jgi:two-component system response regulator (stage 0 sporulation protein F)
MASILLIDDDERLRTLAAHVLRRAGHSVVEAGDGKVGLDLFNKGGADLVITDMVMPEMEGFEVLMELRKRRPPVKMIAMSGGGLRKPLENLRMAGHMGARVLTKPFSTDQLIAAVNEVLLVAATGQQEPAT